MQRSSELSIICYSLKGSGYFSDLILPFTFTVNAALRSERIACLMISGKHLVNLFACSHTSEVRRSEIRCQTVAYQAAPPSSRDCYRRKTSRRESLFHPSCRGAVLRINDHSFLRDFRLQSWIVGLLRTNDVEFVNERCVFESVA